MWEEKLMLDFSSGASRLVRAAAVALVTLGVTSTTASAQDWPTRPVTFVVPFDAGGSADRMARGVADHMSPRLGVPIQVVNRPGGAGALGATWFMQQPDDGSHVMFMQATPYLASAILVSGAPVQWTDFQLMNAQWNDYGIIAVHRDSPYETLADLVAALRTPGAVSSGIIVGNGGHLQTLILNDALDIPNENIRFVTYSGGGPLRTALAGNQVDFEILAAEAAEPIRDRIRVLAVVNDEDADDWGAPPLNEALAEMGVEPVTLMGGNVTGPIVHASLPQSNPENYEILLDAYRETIESEEFKAWAQQARMGADWVGPQDSQALIDEAYENVSRYADEVK
jgi:putative tricarboxylic transport membrane protein